MAYQDQTFKTAGSNALKAPEVEYDIFVRPPFSDSKDQAPIIDLSELFESHSCRTRLENSADHETVAAANGGSIIGALKSFIVNNQLLKGLFEQRSSNTYRTDDVITFAKGFTATGIAAFVLIMFGV